MNEVLQINDRYTLTSKIGHGGFADVFLAYDKITKRNVAVKYLSIEIEDEESENYKKFKQELITMADINSPHVAKIYDSGICNKHPFVVMEYIKGKSLKSIIRQQGYLLVEEVNNYVMQILDGIAACHDRGIIHKDIKPENFVVRIDGSVVILDFGTAFLIEKRNNSYFNDKKIAGTLPYMAPEYVKNPLGSPSVDIYAIGISMFEMFTGKLPFVSKDNDPKETFRMHINNELPNISELNPLCPESYQRIIKKACAKKVEERYQNCYELKNDLIQAYQEYKNPTPIKESFFKKLFKRKK